MPLKDILLGHLEAEFQVPDITPDMCGRYRADGFPGSAGGKELTCQCRRYKRLWFDPSVGKTNFSILAWRIPMNRAALQPIVHKGTHMTEAT